MNTELEPCPFCGSADISDGEVLTEYPNGKTTKQSMCNDCKALGAEAVLDQDEVDYGDVKAIAAWNRRAAQPVSAGLTDEKSFEKFWADKYGEILEPTGDEEADAACRIAKCAAGDAWDAALLSAAQRDSQPVADTSADARDAEQFRNMRARTLLTLLWRKYDAAGTSMGRSYEAVLLEAVMTLLGDPDPNEIARLDIGSGGELVDETRTYLSSLRAQALGFADAAIAASREAR